MLADWHDRGECVQTLSVPGVVVGALCLGVRRDDGAGRVHPERPVDGVANVEEPDPEDDVYLKAGECTATA